MSGTEIPVLDPKNILHDPDDPLSPPLVEKGYVVDPIARTTVRFGGSSSYDYPQGVVFSDQIRLAYAPKVKLEMFQKKKFDEIEALFFEESVYLAELSLTCTTENDIVVARVVPGIFSGIGPQVWNQWWAKHTEEDSKYRFWPEDVPGRNKAIATHFLHFLPHVIKGNVWSPKSSEGEMISKFVVAIDAKLATYIGVDKFPFQEQQENGDIVIFKGELGNG